MGWRSILSDILAVTSFSQAGWESYAERGIKSFCKNFPGKIAAYYEDDPPAFNHPKLEWRPLYEVDGLSNVLRWAKENPALKGKLPSGEYCYNYDLYKFCRKVFAQVDAGLGFNGVMYWLDADSYFTRKVPAKLLRNIIEGYYTAAPFRTGFHIESGLVVWDTAHEKNVEFMDAYKLLYTRGDILQLPGFHDCWAYQAAIGVTGVTWKNLSPGGKRMEDVMHLTPLAKYFKHDKGILKYVKAGDDAA